MPTAPFTALERRRSEFLFQTAVVLSAAEGPASFWYHSSHVLDHGEAWEQEAMYMLVNAAAEPLMRRLVHVRGELRFSFARLASLFGGDAGEPAATDVVADAFRATRFRIEDLPRLLAGLRIPETFIAGGRSRFLGEEGLLILLVRLAFPGRNSVLAAEAGRWPSETSSCFNFLMQFIYDEVHALTPRRRTPLRSATVVCRSRRSSLACAIGGASRSGSTTSRASRMLSMLVVARYATYSASSTASCSMCPGPAGTRQASKSRVS